ncbi:MAG: hypothetical protein JXR76_09010 [Deltaproteobacteria bacterium]|nr:hypothetical protein [Deltaproteobacteria bacterium]
MTTAGDAYRIRKNDGGLVFYTRYFGNVTLNVLMEASSKRLADPEFKKAVFSIQDLNEASRVDMSADDVRTFGYHVRNVLETYRHLVLITVVKDPVAYGLSRIWKGAARPSSNELHVVHTEAAAWDIVKRICKDRNL